MNRRVTRSGRQYIAAPPPGRLVPGETWNYRCPHGCPVVTQNGVRGLGAHLDVVHPDEPWPDDARPYAIRPRLPAQRPRRIRTITPPVEQPALFEPEDLT